MGAAEWPIPSAEYIFRWNIWVVFGADDFKYFNVPVVEVSGGADVGVDVGVGAIGGEDGSDVGNTKSSSSSIDSTYELFLLIFNPSF